MEWGRAWTDEERNTAIQLRRAGHGFAEICELLSRSMCSVRGFLNRNHILIDPDVRHRNMQKAQVKRQRQYKSSPSHRTADYVGHVVRVAVPDYVIAERDKRANEPRAGGGMLGEPPFSQSALGLQLALRAGRG